MAGFRKAKAEQAALKLGMYASSGKGKTLTSLLIAEGLVQGTGKRIAMVDTERGSDFYVKDVPERAVHPAAFDIDALYSRSLIEVLGAVKQLDPNEYGVLIIDSITHLWEAARLAYEGRQTRAGTIPMQAWASIKKPYKELIAFLLSSPMHVIMCGREGVMYEESESGELKAAGFKMKAEGETAYEPHILIRLDSVKEKRGNVSRIVAYAEKDRTGILAGKTFNLWPGDADTTFNTLVKPILPLLGGTQARIETEDEIASKDGEAQAEQEKERHNNSVRTLTEFSARLDLAKTAEELKAIGKEITKDVKAQMLPAHVAALRERYHNAENRVNGVRTLEPADAA